MSKVGLHDLKSLPPVVAQVMAPHVAAEQPETLAKISQSLSKKREEARNARSASGIEKVWQSCEEAYVGIDDANRAQFSEAKWAKPMSNTGPITTEKTPKAPDYKSTVYVRLTARYVDAGAAKLAEILLSPYDRPFSFSEMPVPHLIRAKQDKSQVVLSRGGQPLMRPAQPHELAAAGAQPSGAMSSPASPPGGAMPTATPAVAPSSQTGAPPTLAPAGTPAQPGAAPKTGQPPQVPLTVKDLAEEAIELARAKAKKAEDQVWDWLVRSRYNGEARKMIFDAARIGVGVIKGPVPEIKRSIAASKFNGGVEVQIEENLLPVVKWRDPWNIFPDPACGENIHEGDYIFDRDYLSVRQLTKLRDQPGYIGSEIDKLLLEGPGNPVPDSNRQRKDGDLKNRYEVWYYYGVLSDEEYQCLCAVGNPVPGEDSPERPEVPEQVYAIVTIVNDRVIKAVLNPLESGSFPYHSVPWQRRAGHWAGIGVAEQITAPQNMVNAATRAMLNNAGKSSGSQIIINRTAVSPADGNWVMTPDKIWFSNQEMVDVRAAMGAFEVPNTTKQLQSIVDRAMQLAEEATSIPLVTQGESGVTTPDTFGAARLQDNNANQLLRSIGYAFDDFVTEPLIRQMYEWYLLDPDIDDEDKGEFQINAHGSEALVDRAIENQAIGQMGAMVLNSAYGFDPKRWAKQYIKANRLDPVNFQYTAEEQQRLDSTPPPKPPQVQAAEINAQAAVEQSKLRQQTAAQQTQIEEQKTQGDQQLASKKLDIAQHKNLTDATVKLHEMQTQRDLLMLEYSLKHGLTLMQVKADLASKAMELNTQRDLNAADNATDLHKHAMKAQQERPGKKPVMKPPVQVPGKASNGKAFAQA